MIEQALYPPEADLGSIPSFATTNQASKEAFFILMTYTTENSVLILNKEQGMLNEEVKNAECSMIAFQFAF